MFIEPNSHIKIYRNIESSGSRRPLFKTQAAQTAYFTAHLAFDYTPTTVVKHQLNHVRVGLTVAQLQGCNYLSFVNPSFGNKVYYANIVSDPIYVNNECTELIYAVDFCQTDMFNVTMEPCYNDREQLTDEDYTKSVTDPFDDTIQELFTSEPLSVSKDLEINYTMTDDQSSDCFLAGHSIEHAEGVTPYAYMDVIAIPHITPPNPTALQWFGAWLLDLINSDTHYGMIFYNGSIQVNDQVISGFRFSDKMLDDLIEGTPEYYSDINPTYDIFCCEVPRALDNNYDPIWGEDGLIANLNTWASTNGTAANNILAVHKVPAFCIANMFGTRHNFVNVDLPDVSSYHNKKLARYPFSYIRVETPTGDTKELQFERFDLKALTLEKPDTAQLDIVFDYNTTPELSLVPMYYKRKGAGATRLHNFSERLTFNAIPQMPYTTDSFLASLAAANADILARRTASASYDIDNAMKQMGYAQTDLTIQEIRNGQQQIKEDAELTASALATAVTAPTIVGGIVGAYHTAQTGMKNYVNQTERQNALDRANSNLEATKAKTQMEYSKFYSAGGLSLQYVDASPIYDEMKDTKPLYVCDNYISPVGTGLQYYSKASFWDFIVTRVKLRDSILQKYDQWFSNYGYASGRYGVPRIAAYIANAATGKPHFAPSGSQKITYVKTTDAHVIAPNKTSEQFWEAMLNGGCQFIKGEELT